MITKIRSQKIAAVKVLFWMLLSVGFIATSSCSQKKLAKSAVSQAKSEQTDDKIYEQVEQMPEFPGGQVEMQKFLVNSVKYPYEAMQKKIQGKVFVGFVVDKEGVVKNAKVVRGADPLLDAEALRVVKSFPVWSPGMEKGKKVAVQFTIPINFMLH